MENKFGIFHSETYGDLRIIMEDETPLFCARDLGTMLGFKDIGSVINHHCKNVRKCKCPTPAGMQAMNYIDPTDAAHLLSHTTSIAADDIAEWLFTTVIPTVLHAEGIEGVPDDEQDENTAEVTDDDVFLIHVGDYCNYVENLFMMCRYAYDLAKTVEKLPDSGENTFAKYSAQYVLRNCKEILDGYGFDFKDLEVINHEKIDVLFDHDVITPAEAGYFTAEQLSDALCDGISELVAELLDNDA